LPYQNLYRVIDANRSEYESFLDTLDAHRQLLHAIPHQQNGEAPYWNNGWFTALDGAALVNMLAWKKPKRYMEIGSGHSTRFARYTIDASRLETTLTSIDPMPRQGIDRLCTRVIRKPLEDCDPAIVDELEAGDILFYDGSHRVFSNSDAMVFFFEVMPRVKPGVIVHIHDIFLPGDYPSHWNKRLYNEQYVLAAMLLSKPSFRVIAPIAFISEDSALSARVKDIFTAPGGRNIPFMYPEHNGPETTGASFWIETI
jgi:predicted O-methyltransferase YrrM